MNNGDPDFERKCINDLTSVLTYSGITAADYKEMIEHTSIEYKNRLIIQEKKLCEVNYQDVDDKKFQLWRERQAQRLRAIYHKPVFDSLPRIPFAFELSKGCSFQCPFCCFDTPKLEKTVEFTKDNEKLWNEILEFTKNIVGIPLETALCYYATEPFDNPDYEKFAYAFKTIVGQWPRVTTASSIRDSRRMRKYMEMIGNDELLKGKLNFSVLSLPFLREIHNTYTPEELEFVPLILNNVESGMKYSPAGRAAKMLVDHNRYAITEDKFYMPGPVSCLNGFVVNLVDHTIRLVATCVPNDQHPYGYFLFDERTFEDANDYSHIITEMINKNMSDFFQDEELVIVDPSFTISPLQNGFVVSSAMLHLKINGDPVLNQLGNLIRNGNRTWNQICQEVDNPFLLLYYVQPRMKTLFQRGIFERSRSK